jgi:hypothetical protein
MNIVFRIVSKCSSHKTHLMSLRSQTFVYGCHGRVAVVVRRVMHIVLVVMFFALWGQVHTVFTPTENRIRIWILIKVPIWAMRVGVCLGPHAGHAPLLGHGTAPGAGRDHVPVVSPDAYSNTPDVKRHCAPWRRRCRCSVWGVGFLLDHVYCLAKGPDVVMGEP